MLSQYASMAGSESRCVLLVDIFFFLFPFTIFDLFAFLPPLIVTQVRGRIIGWLSSSLPTTVRHFYHETTSATSSPVVSRRKL